MRASARIHAPRFPKGSRRVSVSERHDGPRPVPSSTARVRPRRVHPTMPTGAPRSQSVPKAQAPISKPDAASVSPGNDLTSVGPDHRHGVAGSLAREPDRNQPSAPNKGGAGDRPLTSDSSRSVGRSNMSGTNPAGRRVSRSTVGPPLASVPTHVREAVSRETGPASQTADPRSSGSGPGVPPDSGFTGEAPPRSEPSGIITAPAGPAADPTPARLMPSVFRRRDPGPDRAAPTVGKRPSLLQRVDRRSVTGSSTGTRGVSAHADRHDAGVQRFPHLPDAVPSSVAVMSQMPSLSGTGLPQLRRSPEKAVGSSGHVGRPSGPSSPVIRARPSVAARRVRATGPGSATGSDSVQRRSNASGPPPSSAISRSTQSKPTPVAPRSRRRSAAPISPAIAAVESESVDAGAVQRSATSSVSVDRQVRPRSPETREPIARAAAPHEGSAAGVDAGEGGSGDGDDEELEELVKKLYPKLRHKLQAGLLIERERAGKLTDLF